MTTKWHNKNIYNIKMIINCAYGVYKEPCELCWWIDERLARTCLQHTIYWWRASMRLDVEGAFLTEPMWAILACPEVWAIFEARLSCNIKPGACGKQRPMAKREYPEPFTLHGWVTFWHVVTTVEPILVCDPTQRHCHGWVTKRHMARKTPREGSAWACPTPVFGWRSVARTN
jgi:hypothetical protein